LPVAVGSSNAGASGLTRIAGNGNGDYAAALYRHQIAMLPGR